MKFIFPLVLLLISCSIQCQDLSQHQWKARLILLLTDDESDSVYNQQLSILNSDADGVKERKLIVYTILPEKYKVQEALNFQWYSGSSTYDKYKKTPGSFEFVLIGLDGGVKKRKAGSPMKLNELYGTIDGMPMRRAELRRKKN